MDFDIKQSRLTKEETKYEKPKEDDVELLGRTTNFLREDNKERSKPEGDNIEEGIIEENKEDVEENKNIIPEELKESNKEDDNKEEEKNEEISKDEKEKRREEGVVSKLIFDSSIGQNLFPRLKVCFFQ